MDRTIHIAELENEFQAQIVGQLLESRGLPHIIRSYHDSAYDGLFQTTLGWGCVEAPESFKEDVLAVVEKVRVR
ncbi:MAG: hypothetical protein HUU46_05525 [Candidatus Hydrogenedentes bacterium]|nr:hypothetical protein [Candidatus Hydrogenedentota bacterium]